MPLSQEINSTLEEVFRPRLHRYDVDTLVSEFKENGVVTLRQWLSTDEVNELSCNIAPHIERTKREGQFAGIQKSIEKHDAWFYEHINRGPQVELIEQLLGVEIVPASAGCFAKPANAREHRVDPHRDSFKIEPYPTGATIWFALDPTSEANGGVHFLKGSHRREMNVEEASADMVYKAELQPGDATIHSSQTIHWSKGNPTPKPRRGVTYFYWTQRMAANWKDKMPKKLDDTLV